MDFTRKYDLVAVGGGIAGVAAAVAAARAGKKTALVEKTIFTGGLATTGLIYIYLPLCDGFGRQVTFGLAEELLLKSIAYGPGKIPENWRKGQDAEEKNRYRVVFSPASYIIALDEILREAGVDVWFDTLFCTSVMDGDRLAAIEIENKSGRGRLEAGVFVDCTGDADVALRAGAPCVDGDNYLTIWALVNTPTPSTRRKDDGTENLHMAILGGGPAGHNKPAGSRVYRGIDGEAVSHFVMESRRLLLDHYKKLFAEGGGHNRLNSFPITLPSMPQHRMSRHIVGQVTMTDGGYGKHVEDSIGLYADWRKSGYVWEVPYRSLLPQKVKGLLAAGRCMASEGDAWDVMRVIPAAALTGEAAGIAGSMALDRNIMPDELPVADLQKKLRESGFPLHLEDVGLKAEG